MSMFEILHGQHLVDDVERRLRRQIAEDGGLSLRDAVAQAAAGTIAFRHEDAPDRQMPGVMMFCSKGVPEASTARTPEAAEPGEPVAVKAPPTPQWRSPWRRVEGASVHLPANGMVGGPIATLLAQAAAADLPCDTPREAAAVVAVMRIGSATGAWRVASGRPPAPWRVGELEMASVAWLLDRLPGRVRASAPLLADAGVLAHYRADLMEAAGVDAVDVQPVRAFGTLLEAMAFAGFEAAARYYDDDDDECCFLDERDFDDALDGGPSELDAPNDLHAGIADIPTDTHDAEPHPCRDADEEPLTLFDEDGQPRWRHNGSKLANHETDPETLLCTLSEPAIIAGFAVLLPVLLGSVASSSQI